MRLIDQQQWPRRPIFDYFRHFDIPQYNLTAQLDLTRMVPLWEDGLSKFCSVLHLVCQAANQVPSLKQRIRGSQVVEHDVVHPSFTTQTDDGLFSFGHAAFSPDYREFAGNVAADQREVQDRPLLFDAPGRDDELYISCLPWMSFQSLTHPIAMNSEDSVPRISWGKIVAVDGKWLVSVNLQVHHGLGDGRDLGRFFEVLQVMADEPAVALTGGGRFRPRSQVGLGEN